MSPTGGFNNSEQAGEMGKTEGYGVVVENARFGWSLWEVEIAERTSTFT